MYAIAKKNTTERSSLLRINTDHKRLDKKNKLMISAQEGFEIIDIKDIIHCHAEGSYCHIYLKDKQFFIVSKNLKTVESVLAEYEFIRVHQSHLIAFAEIKKMDADGISLLDGKKVPVARSKRQQIISLLKQSHHQL